MTTHLGAGIHAGGSLPVPTLARGVWVRGHGITSSGGFVDSWAPLVGTAGSWTAAGSSRPALASNALEFDGVDDTMGQAALDTSGLPAASWAAWLRQTSQLADSAPLESATYPTGLLSLTRTNTSIDAFNGTPADIARSTGPLPAAQWAFFAQVFDGSAPAGQKVKIYRGTSPSNVVDVTAFDNTVITALPAAAGSAQIGGRATIFFQGGISLVALYATALSLDRLRQLAAFQRP